MTGISRPMLIAFASLGVVVVFYVLREHWGHALGAPPYLLLLACPLLQLFHGHGGIDMAAGNAGTPRGDEALWSPKAFEPRTC